MKKLTIFFNAMGNIVCLDFGHKMSQHINGIINSVESNSLSDLIM